MAYALDRPHATLAAGVVVIAAGVYELTPVKRHFRRRCRADAGSGLGFGLCCAGSTIGLMAMLVALDVMSLLWMSVVAVLACAQKLLPGKASVDVPLALAIAKHLALLTEAGLVLAEPGERRRVRYPAALGADAGGAAVPGRARARLGRTARRTQDYLDRQASGSV